jgi:hypothetical protein
MSRGLSPPLSNRPKRYPIHCPLKAYCGGVVAFPHAVIRQRPVMAEPAYPGRSAIGQFPRGADVCRQLAAREPRCGEIQVLPIQPPRFATRMYEAPVMRPWRAVSLTSAAPDRLRSGNWAHRTTRTRGQDTCPNAAVSMRHSRRSSGSQEPPRATKRLAASMRGPSLS